MNGFQTFLTSGDVGALI